jgi:hypothetical protein
VFHFRTLCGCVIIELCCSDLRINTTTLFAGTKVPEADLEVHQRQHRSGAHAQGPEGPRGKTLPHSWQGTYVTFSLYTMLSRGFFVEVKSRKATAWTLVLFLVMTAVEIVDAFFLSFVDLNLEIRYRCLAYGADINV